LVWLTEAESKNIRIQKGPIINGDH